jgi:hypothetical protein
VTVAVEAADSVTEKTAADDPELPSNTVVSWAEMVTADGGWGVGGWGVGGTGVGGCGDGGCGDGGDDCVAAMTI